MPWYWLLTTYGALGLEVFVEKTPTGEVIVPVFGSADEAAGHLSESTGPWKPRKTSRGELVTDRHVHRRRGHDGEQSHPPEASYEAPSERTGSQ